MILFVSLTPCTAQDSAKVAIDKRKLYWLAEEAVRANGLRVDTALLKEIIYDQRTIMNGQGLQLKADDGIMAAKDSVVAEYKRAYENESKNHKVTADKLNSSRLINKVLVLVTVLLGALIVIQK